MITLNDIEHSRRSLRGKWTDVVLWFLFFVWIGILLLIKDIPDGVGSLGIGALVLGGALVRFILGASVSSFWLIIAIVFIVAGIGGFLSIDLPFLSIALLVCGVLLLFHSKSGRSRGA